MTVATDEFAEGLRERFHLGEIGSRDAFREAQDRGSLLRKALAGNAWELVFSQEEIDGMGYLDRLELHELAMFGPEKAEIGSALRFIAQKELQRLEVLAQDFEVLAKEEGHDVRMGDPMPTKAETSPRLGVEEAARFLGLQVSTVYKMTASGELPHYKPRGKLYFLRTELEAWIARKRVAGRSELEKQASRIRGHKTK